MMSVSPSHSMGFFIQTGTGRRIFNNCLNYSRFELNGMHTYDTKRHVQECYVSFQNWKPLTYPLAK